jgi:hypothetical protein
VKIYIDPFTRMKLEGDARLIRRVETSADGTERWMVEFTDEKGKQYERIIVME